jgi:hypothetical protein
MRDQTDQDTALGFRDPPLASRSRPVSQAVEAAHIEGHEALAYRLWVALEFGGNDSRAQPLPTQDHHLRSADPIARGMATARQFVDLSFFQGIQRWAGKKQFGHAVLLLNQS